MRFATFLAQSATLFEKNFPTLVMLTTVSEITRTIYPVMHGDNVKNFATFCYRYNNCLKSFSFYNFCKKIRLSTVPSDVVSKILQLKMHYNQKINFCIMQLEKVFYYVILP